MRRSSKSSIIANSPLWRISSLSLCLAVALGAPLAEANFHTEAGNFPTAPKAVPKTQPQYYDADLVAQPEEQQEGQLADIVSELNAIRNQQRYYDELNAKYGAPQQDVDGIPVETADDETLPKARLGRVADQQEEPALEGLRGLGNSFRELSQARNEQKGQSSLPQEEEKVPVEKPTKSLSKSPANQAEEVEESNDEEEDQKPLHAEKKGEAEFVGFIAPENSHHNKKLQHKEYLEKRISSEDERGHSRHRYRAFNFISSSGNVIFVAFVTMCCVFSVVGVVGGMYYYNHIRTSREDPFDDFTRYSPAGPGRDKLKKGRANAFGGFEKGDESLAYKAQLHHYQQTKQKIIGEQGAIGGAGCDADASDKSDDEADLEHNFSVYECPGLAPTGDIEVQNPNFIESPTAQKKPSLK